MWKFKFPVNIRSNNCAHYDLGRNAYYFYLIRKHFSQIKKRKKTLFKEFIYTYIRNKIENSNKRLIESFLKKKAPNNIKSAYMENAQKKVSARIVKDNGLE